MPSSPLVAVCWYLASGIYQLFKQPLLFTHLTTLPDRFWRANDVCQTLQVYTSEKQKDNFFQEHIDELALKLFNYLLTEQPSHQMIL